MMITALTLLLLSAEPTAASAASLGVASTAPPGLEKVAAEAGQALGAQLEAPLLELGSHLKAQNEGCQKELRCMLAAPGIGEATRLLHLHSRPLSGGRLAVDLRLIDVQSRKVLGRSAAMVEAGEVIAWARRASSRLLARVDPYVRNPLPSPFALKRPPPQPPPDPRPAAEPPK